MTAAECTFTQIVRRRNRMSASPSPTLAKNRWASSRLVLILIISSTQAQQKVVRIARKNSSPLNAAFMKIAGQVSIGCMLEVE